MKKLNFTITFFLVLGSFFMTFPQSNAYLKSRILVEGMYSRNLGNFGNIWSKASGGYVGYSIAFPAHNLLLMRTGFIYNTLKDNNIYEDATLTMIPIEIGGRYYFTDSRLMPFFQFINGLNFVFENITNLGGETKDKTMIKYAWQIGLGVTLNLTNNFNVDVSANYQSNFYETDAMNTGFEYVVGIGLAL